MAQSGPPSSTVQCSPCHMCAHPPCWGGSSLFVIKIVGCFLLSPSLSPLSFSRVKRSSLCSFSPQIWLLITFQTLSRIDFHSLWRVFFVCLRQRVSWSESRVSQSRCDGIIPHSPPPTGSISASGWKWELQLCAGLARTSPCRPGWPGACLPGVATCVLLFD